MVHARLHGRASRLPSRSTTPARSPAAATRPRFVRSPRPSLHGGVVIRVISRGRHLVSLGAVNAPWWQRRATGSRRIRVGSVRGPSPRRGPRPRHRVRAPRQSPWFPPPRCGPPTPTFGSPATPAGHDDARPARGGSPRLVLTKEYVWAGERQPVFRLQERTTIGSDAELRHLPRRAWRRTTRSSSTTTATSTSSPRSTAPPGYTARSSIVRCCAPEPGSRSAPHRLVFFREEYADHGRPHGGRIGGEAGHQIPQPPRAAM